MNTIQVHRPFFQPFTFELNKFETKPFEALVQKIQEQWGETLNFAYELAFLMHPDERCHEKNKWIVISSDKKLKAKLDLTYPSFVNKIKINGEPEDLIQSAIKAGIDFSRQSPDKEVAFRKMSKNATKAIEENIVEQRHSMKKFPVDFGVLEDLSSLPAPVGLQIHVDVEEDIGVRPTMEDAWIACTTENGYLAGVFDGHSGSRTARAIARFFPHLFQQQLRSSDNHVYQAFGETFDALHAAFFDLFDDASTAVVSYIDLKSNLIYTATLGDSEANIYRPHENKISSIPLSCVRDFTSKSDYERASEAIEDDSEFEEFRDKMRTLKQKYLFTEPMRVKAEARFHYGNGFYGPNVSRAFGDKPFFTFNDVEVMSKKPKITVQFLKPGDVVVLACDGLKDYVSEFQIINVIKSAKIDAEENKYSAAKDLVKAAKDAFERAGHGDNVTVVTIRIEQVPQD